MTLTVRIKNIDTISDQKDFGLLHLPPLKQAIWLRETHHGTKISTRTISLHYPASLISLLVLDLLGLEESLHLNPHQRT